VWIFSVLIMGIDRFFLIGNAYVFCQVECAIGRLNYVPRSLYFFAFSIRWRSPIVCGVLNICWPKNSMRYRDLAACCDGCGI